MDKFPRIQNKEDKGARVSKRINGLKEEENLEQTEVIKQWRVVFYGITRDFYIFFILFFI